MKAKLTTYLPLAAIAAGVVLAAKKGGVSGVGRCSVGRCGVGATNDALAFRLIDEAGLDLNKSYYQLSWGEVDQLVDIMKRCKYRPAKNAPGSPARMFWYRLKRKM